MTRVLEYDADRGWLLATEQLRRHEYGASTVVARDVPLSVGLAIIAVLEQARAVAEWHDAIPWEPFAKLKLNDDLAELGRLVGAI